MLEEQTIEGNAFLQRLAALPEGPDVDLSPVLEPSLQDEAELRKLFATDRNNERLSDPYVGLIDVFEAPSVVRTTRARVVTSEEDKNAKYICPLNDYERREEGSPSMVPDIETFKKSWDVFTEGTLSLLADWKNVIAAGGSVLGCLLPLPKFATENRRAMRKYFNSSAYFASDVDLFLWGLTPEQAEEKIKRIYEAVQDSVPQKVICVRTKHAISIYSQYPCRCVQIVLRLYHSPAEILAGFDVDAPCVMYDGSRVMANPRAIVAFMRQCNTIDVTRRSPSYEIRLMKYAERGFEILVPDLRRAKIDPIIFEIPLHRVEGLARLLVLEELSTQQVGAYPDPRGDFTSCGTKNSGKSRHRKKQYNLKTAAEVAGLESSDYGPPTSFHIPYGPGWNAKRIKSLVYTTDLGMNSEFSLRESRRRLHRHVAFCGTMEECIEDCCRNCPIPNSEGEKKLFEKESESYITGRISFIQEDPGRQSMTGSFKPIDSGEWSTQAYIDDMEQLLAAILDDDLPSVHKLVSEGIIDVNCCDHAGRIPLHVAILRGAVDIANYLIDSGARFTSQFVDDRSALHFPTQNDFMPVSQELIELMKDDDESENNEMEEDKERNSIEDDWSSDENDSMITVINQDEDRVKDNERLILDPADIFEDLVQSTVSDISVKDSEMSSPPLNCAIIASSLPVITFLLDQGADPVVTILQLPRDQRNFNLSTLVLLTKDEFTAAKIVEKLLGSGVATTSANTRMFKIFHQSLLLVLPGKTYLVQTALGASPKVKIVANFPGIYHMLITPSASPAALYDYDIVVMNLYF